MTEFLEAGLMNQIIGVLVLTAAFLAGFALYGLGHLFILKPLWRRWGLGDDQ